MYVNILFYLFHFFLPLSFLIHIDIELLKNETIYFFCLHQLANLLLKKYEIKIKVALEKGVFEREKRYNHNDGFKFIQSQID